MGKSALAFAPGHISGYFRRVDGKTFSETGSIGAGIVTDKGVFVKMTESMKTTVKINGREADGWLIEEVLQDNTAAVEVISELPIGAGFGMSAAGVLASYYAVNELYSLGLTREAIAEASHEIEVRCGTGLGDVAAENGGGLVVRNAPGICGVTSRMYPDAEFYALSFGEMKTNDIITDEAKMQTVCDAFPAQPVENLAQFMKNSLSFTKNSGLCTKRVAKLLAECEKHRIPASMTMLGEGVFACGSAAKTLLSQYGIPYSLKISKTGPYVLEVV